ncbi:hypothetical protein KQH82_03290 [bacterium]|nr:hypothetical protein [bacterium]
MSHVRTLVVVAIVALLSARGLASPPRVFSFDAGLRLEAVPDAGGRVHGRAIIIPVFEGEEIQVKVDSVVSLSYDGPTDYVCPGKVGDTCWIDFEIDIPNNALSAFRVDFHRGAQRQTQRRCFDLRGDKSLIYLSDPSLPYVFPTNYEPPPKRIVTVEDIYGPPPDQQVIRIPAPDTVPQHRSRWKGYDVAPVVTRIEDTAGSAQWGFCVEDELDSGWVLLGKTDSIIARMPKELFFKHYMLNQQAEADNGHIEPTKKAGKGTPR